MHTEQTIREELQQIHLAIKCIDELNCNLYTTILKRRLCAIGIVLEWILEETLTSGVKEAIEDALDDNELKIFKNKFGYAKHNI